MATTAAPWSRTEPDVHCQIYLAYLSHAVTFLWVRGVHKVRTYRPRSPRSSSCSSSFFAAWRAVPLFFDSTASLLCLTLFINRGMSSSPPPGPQHFLFEARRSRWPPEHSQTATMPLSICWLRASVWPLNPRGPTTTTSSHKGPAALALVLLPVICSRAASTPST